VQRIEGADPASAPEPVRDALGKLTPLQIFRVLARAEGAFRPSLRFGAAVLGSMKLDAALRELAILQVARQSGAAYEWVQHVPIALAVGASQEQTDAVERGELDAPVLGEAGRAVLQATKELVADSAPSDAAYEELAQHLDEQEIVELVLAVGWYLTLAMLMRTAGLEPEEPLGTDVIEQVERARGAR
jgi:alkylhydroperoxidase family enzyme